MASDIEYYRKFEPLFGSWKIIRLLGEGSFGKVFEIEKEEFGAVYKSALKVITVPQSESDLRSAEADGMDEESIITYYRSFVEDFSRESALMAKLKGHTNIVSFEDTQILEHTDSIGWDIFIRMELLTPLNAYLKEKGGSLSADETVKLGIDLCKALELCENYNIIHRDIKPENIFVSELGDFKLGDFGISRMAEKTQGASTRVGTRDYMAPEVFKGERYDQTVDVYSLSLVIYKLLNGNRLPFLPPAPQAISFSQRNEAIEKRISGANIDPPSGADEALALAVVKGCSPVPKDRYQNALDMRRALEKCANIEPKSSVMIPPAAHDEDKSVETVGISREITDQDWDETVGREWSRTSSETETNESSGRSIENERSETVGAVNSEKSAENEIQDSFEKTIGYDWADTADSQSPVQNLQNKGFGKKEKRSKGIPLAGKIGIGIASVLVVIGVIAAISGSRKSSSYNYMSNVNSYSMGTGSSTSEDIAKTSDIDTSDASDDDTVKTAESHVSDTVNDSKSSPKYCTVSDSVKIRKSASSDAEVIGNASPGDIYEITSTTNPDWTEIDYNGTTAYVRSGFVIGASSNASTGAKYTDDEEDDGVEISHEIGTYTPSIYKHLSWDHSVQEILYNCSTNVILQNQIYGLETDLSLYFDGYYRVDLDGDGYIDSVCVTINDSDFTSNINIKFGNGNEIVSGPFSMSPNEGQMVYFIDLNGDNVDEILVTHMTESTAGPVAWNCYLYEWSGKEWKTVNVVDDEGRPLLGGVDSLVSENKQQWSVRDVQLCDDYLLYLVDYGYKDGPDQTFDLEVFCLWYDGNTWQLAERSKEAGWDISEWAWRVGLM